MEVISFIHQESELNMRGILTGLSIAVAATVLVVAPAHSATYQFSYDSASLDITNAVITTNAQNVAISMTGFLVYPTSVKISITGIIPTTTANLRYKQLWTWNNKFVPTSPNVDIDGIFFSMADGSVANYFRQNGKYILSVANPAANIYTYYNNTSTAGGNQTVAPVPLPPSVMTLGAGLAGLAGLGRRTAARKKKRLVLV
jgi:glucan phosphoethanolaminetransferase (alkaline phosphatase superfamily)